jgi:2-oxoglutarate/2-oxoacid ferredoxin oxidoreductase subunit alpha
VKDVRAARAKRRVAQSCYRKRPVQKCRVCRHFEKQLVHSAANTAHRVVVPEMNRGQLALEVERVVGRQKVVRVNRANGEMVTPQMILEAIEGR